MRTDFLNPLLKARVADCVAFLAAGGISGKGMQARAGLEKDALDM